MSYLSYLVFRFFAFWIGLLPSTWIVGLGKGVGLLLYYVYAPYRKRALSNLALATKLALSEEEIVRLAKESLQNLSIVFLQYPKLAKERDIHKIAKCENPEVALPLKSVIFFCGHQANWEVLFLEGTSRMPGVAIGRPIKNRFLYRWCTEMREKYGGKIIRPQNALKESLRALREGKFIGIVGDQGMPDSGFCSPFLGRKAWTSPLPALLSLRTGSPIIVATVRREKENYVIHYSDPIWPEGKDVQTIMETALALFEKSVIERPGEWFWIHNRWKQRPAGVIPRNLRYDSIAIVFSDDLSLLPRLRAFYPQEFLTLFVPRGMMEKSPDDIEVIPYDTVDDILIRDFRFKLVIDLTHNRRIKSHFLRLSAFKVIHDPSLFL